MNLKTTKMSFMKEKLITFIVASSAVMVILCCFWFKQKKSVVRDF